jgi:hypothetical protein
MVILLHRINLSTANTAFCHPILDMGSKYGQYHP